MTRKKKTRKLGVSKPMRLSKEKLQELKDLKQQKAKKRTGNKAGSRNSEVLIESNTRVLAKVQDKRLGSKKSIALVPEDKLVDSTPVIPDFRPSVELKRVNPEDYVTPEQELEQLENDARLIDLIERHESGELLKGKEAKYFNSKVARHQELCELLGIDSEEEQVESESQPNGDWSDFVDYSLQDEWLSEDNDSLKD